MAKWLPIEENILQVLPVQIRQEIEECGNSTIIFVIVFNTCITLAGSFLCDAL
jgi:hypothetical protein